MQLTRLDIKGFKSFGDKISIHFDAGITAIVGPNGCGKSNVVDAIRWVLGEQSTRALRSEKMENIIFNGTKTRKAAQLAEVSLSFNNHKQIISSEFSQVTITRKLYRSGESEYRLNDVPCRLKDITDLFLDTGIGSDSYSIIELKMVEELIANKEHSRRRLFEEASGISKYKVRKKQTLNRLKDTESDLARVEDLLFEIEKNLKTLTQQARKAERYYTIREAYKLASISLARQKLCRLGEELQKLQEKETGQQSLREGYNQEMESAESSLQQDKAALMLQEQNLSLQQKALNQEVSKIRNFESEQKIKNAQLSHLQKRESEIEQGLQQDKQQINHIQYSRKRIQEELLLQEEKVTHARTILEEKQHLLEEQRRLQSRDRMEVEDLTRQRQSASASQHQLEKDLAVLKIQVDSLQQQNEKNLQDRNLREKDIAGFKEAIEALETKMHALEKEHTALNETQVGLEEDMESCQEALQQQENEFKTLTRTLDARENEYQLTKSLIDNLEGFPESIRYLKKQASTLKQAPLFSDILYCQADYRVAIESFLEPYMNYYVVDRWEDAWEAVNLLQESAKGRAGFFVLEALPPVKEIPAAGEELLRAMQVIEVESKYHDLCAHLLKGVFLLHPQQTIPEDVPGTLLHPEGKFIKRSMGLSGGSIGLFEGKRIGRAKNLDHLGKTIKKLKQQQQELEAGIQAKQEKISNLKQASRRGEIQTLSQTLTQVQQEHIALHTKYQQYQDFLSQTALQKEDIERKIEELSLQAATLQPELDEKNEVLSNLNALLAKKEEALKETNIELQEQAETFNRLQLEFHQQENKAGGLQKDLEYKEVQLETLESRVTQLSTEFDKVRQEIRETLSQMDGSDTDLIALYQEKENLEKGVQDMEKAYYALRGSVHKGEEAITQIRRNKEQCDLLITEIKEAKNDVRIELSTLKERLAAEFSIEVEAIEEMELLDEEESTLRTRAEKLKVQLEQYGSINPMALEAHQEMEERFEFIKREKQDLLDARTDLLETMKEIDDTAESKFMEAFNQVRENFQKVFRSLFNAEDTCDLIITQPEHVLESDIEIIARPKGKRPLSINQLSGGEKTLTATAILFALYLLKPAPFCIFDEVDAPLDDTNIDKFNRIIRDFSKASQFIIVSHNKRTIASTDIIYGVTMVEPGVSRVVAVDLREAYANVEA